MMTIRTPHPFPYQGSKRSIARHILPFIPKNDGSLIEPFCGSAAISIAAAAHGFAERFWLNDINPSLMTLWSWILERPVELANGYERLWHDQQPDRKKYFSRVRDQFNSTHEPHHLLYLLARIVKGSVRYSSEGNFNQSPDNRRMGMHPLKMRQQVIAVSQVLSNRTVLSSSDFRDVAASATPIDVLYMDPPYQGTSFTRDHRYYEGVSFGEFIEALAWMNDQRLSFMVSYDGRTGEKRHGKPLPEHLQLTHLDIHAGRSSQSTLLGVDHATVESLYLSPALSARLYESTHGFTQAILASGNYGTA
jgi:DNA adenine methylase